MSSALGLTAEAVKAIDVPSGPLAGAPWIATVGCTLLTTVVNLVEVFRPPLSAAVMVMVWPWLSSRAAPFHDHVPVAALGVTVPAGLVSEVVAVSVTVSPSVSE